MGSINHNLKAIVRNTHRNRRETITDRQRQSHQARNELLRRLRSGEGS